MGANRRFSYRSFRTSVVSTSRARSTLLRKPRNPSPQLDGSILGAMEASGVHRPFPMMLRRMVASTFLRGFSACSVHVGAVRESWHGHTFGFSRPVRRVVRIPCTSTRATSACSHRSVSIGDLPHTSSGSRTLQVFVPGRAFVLGCVRIAHAPWHDLLRSPFPPCPGIPRIITEYSQGGGWSEAFVRALRKQAHTWPMQARRSERWRT